MSLQLSDRIKDGRTFSSTAQRQAAIDSIPDDRIRKDTLVWYMVHLKTPAQRAAYIRRISGGRDRDLVPRLQAQDQMLRQYDETSGSPPPRPPRQGRGGGWRRRAPPSVRTKDPIIAFIEARVEPSPLRTRIIEEATLNRVDMASPRPQRYYGADLVRDLEMIRQSDRIIDAAQREKFIETITGIDERITAMVNHLIKLIDTDPDRAAAYFPTICRTIELSETGHHPQQRARARRRLSLINYLNGSPQKNPNALWEQFTLQELRQIFPRLHIDLPQPGSSRQEYIRLIDLKKQKILQNRRRGGSAVLQQDVDLFGNPIRHPVWGTDGNIYDRSSVRPYLDSMTTGRARRTGGKIPLSRFFDTRQQYLQWVKEQRESPVRRHHPSQF